MTLLNGGDSYFNGDRKVGYARGEGDLDGDGRDELFVLEFVPGPSTRSGPTAKELRAFVVPGTVAPGVHQVDTVGIELPQNSDSLGWPKPMGDRNGNGTIDVEESTRPNQTDALDIVEGRDVMRPGPGGRLDSFPAAFEHIDLGGPGRLAAVISTDRRHTTLVRVSTEDHTRHVSVGALQLVAPVEGDPDPNDTPDVHAYRDNGRNVLLLWDRSAKTTAEGTFGLPWMSGWDLDHPCTKISLDLLND
jgi:hypothetical protein